jgi:hypothetical protein
MAILGKHQPDRSILFSVWSDIYDGAKLLRNSYLLKRALEGHGANTYLRFTAGLHEITNIADGHIRNNLRTQIRPQRHSSLLARFCAGDTNKLRREAPPGIPLHIVEPGLPERPHVRAKGWAESSPVMSTSKHHCDSRLALLFQTQISTVSA